MFGYRLTAIGRRDGVSPGRGRAPSAPISRQGGPGVARRWRIRHKLMLGLATAIAILAMLLAVTLNGLWSYYVTMKGIESKLAELDEAEQLKRTVDDLCRALPEKTENPLQTFLSFDQGIPVSQSSLDRYKEA